MDNNLTLELEQEVASIMSFVLTAADHPFPYYYDVPEAFKTPAMYFPQPEITTNGETFRTYASDYSWYINIIAETTERAHAIGMKALSALKRARNLVPLIGEDGTPTGRKLRLNDPALRNSDTGVAQLTIEWRSRRPYDLPDPLKMQRYFINFEDKFEKEVAQNGE